MSWDSSYEAAFTSGMMKSEQAILVRVALDIRNSTGFFRLSEALKALDPFRSECMMLARKQLFTRRLH